MRHETDSAPIVAASSYPKMFNSEERGERIAGLATRAASQTIDPPGDLGEPRLRLRDCAQVEVAYLAASPPQVGSEGHSPSTFQEGWILGRRVPLFSAIALLPKDVLPLFLSFFDESTNASF